MKRSPSLGGLRTGDDPALFDLAEEMAARLQLGDAAGLEAWIAAQGDHVERLRRLLPTVQAMAELGSFAHGPALPSASARETMLGTLGDFHIIREIGRGGMGIVYEAEQISLGRRVALKVLPFAATMDARQLQRFHNEARAAASLHHEHIVPVYAVGCDRGLHFYAMQLINGCTLAEWIAEQDSSGDSVCEATAAYRPPQQGDQEGEETVVERAERTSRPGAAAAGPVGDAAGFRRLATWGMQTAEALEYAHAVGIVHRDIKPGNLMVDGSGKLWVTDFGLARTAAESGLTMTGDLVGTLRYMSPEQALAKHGLVDHRADVYSLGVTLHELLTLRPAVEGKDRQEILHSIAFADPVTPRSLNRALPRELETIVLKAMEKDPEERYATARELAEDLRRFLEDRPVLARRPSLVQRARGWAWRNRTLVGSLAAGLLLAALALGGSVGWVVRDRAMRQDDAERRVAEALPELELGLRAGNPYAPALVRAARRVESELASGLVRAELRARAEPLLADLALLEELELIPLMGAGVKDDHFSSVPADDAYGKAFRRYGMAVEELGPREVGAYLRARVIAAQLAAALDHWAMMRKQAHRPGWQGLLQAASATDPEADAWQDALRDALAHDRGTEEFKKLAATAPVEKLSLDSFRLIGQGLLIHAEKDPRIAEHLVRILRAGQRSYPADLWVNHHLARGLCLLEPPALEEALGFYRVAVALRPDSPGVRLNLGKAHQDKGRLDEAIAEYREVIRLKPDYATAHNNLGGALSGKGQLDEAIAEYREAIRLKPNYPEAHTHLGNALDDKGRADEAIVEYLKAIRLKKDYPEVHYNLGRVLKDKGQLDAAIAEYREAIRLKKDFASAHYSLGNALRDKGRVDEAISEYREAIRLKPDDLDAHNNLGYALAAKGRLDEAIAEFREAIRLKKDDAQAHNNLGAVLEAKSRVDEAIAEYKEAVRLKPDFSEAHYNLGIALYRKGQLDEAIAEYRQAIRLKPDYPGAHNNLAVALKQKGQLKEAIAEYKEAIRLKPDDPAAHYNLGIAFLQKGQLKEAIGEYEEVIRLAPQDWIGYSNLAGLLADSPQPELRDPTRALALAQKAVQLAPQASGAYGVLGEVQYRAGNWQAARQALEKADQLNDEPLRYGGDCDPWFFQAMTYWRLGEKEKARHWYDKAVAWMDKHRPHDQNLRRSRAEAAQLLGLKNPPPAREKPATKP